MLFRSRRLRGAWRAPRRRRPPNRWPLARPKPHRPHRPPQADRRGTDSRADSTRAALDATGTAGVKEGTAADAGATATAGQALVTGANCHPPSLHRIARMNRRRPRTRNPSSCRASRSPSTRVAPLSHPRRQQNRRPQQLLCTKSTRPPKECQTRQPRSRSLFPRRPQKLKSRKPLLTRKRLRRLGLSRRLPRLRLVRRHPCLLSKTARSRS